MNQENEEAAARSIRQALRMCIDRGMQLPFYMAVIANNGSAIVVRYAEGGKGLKCDVLARHGESFTPPVNMMIVDAGGDAARMTWDSDGNQSVH